MFDDEDTSPGIRTIIGPAYTHRPPAVILARAKAGHVVVIPPRKQQAIPVEWGVPEISVTIT